MKHGNNGKISEESFYSLYLYFLSKPLMLQVLLYGKKLASSLNHPESQLVNSQFGKPGVVRLMGKELTNADIVSNFQSITLLSTKLAILVKVLLRDT